MENKPKFKEGDVIYHALTKEPMIVIFVVHNVTLDRYCYEVVLGNEKKRAQVLEVEVQAEKPAEEI